MRLEPDYEELLKLFHKHKVKCCIVGAFATAFYAQPRYTKDIDILVEATVENGKKIISALEKFGFGSLNLTPEDFSEEKQIIQLGYEPVRIDLLTSIKGIGFSEIWKHKKMGTYGKTRVFFIGQNELIKSKKISNRAQDKIDLKTLQAKKK